MRHANGELDCEAVYAVGGLVFGGLAFFAGWIYAIATGGFILGLGLVWLPAFILAVIVRYVWPLLAGLLALGVAAACYVALSGH